MYYVIRNRGNVGRRNRFRKLIPLIIAALLGAAGCAGVRNAETSQGAPAASANQGNVAQQRLVRKGKSQFLHCNSCHVIDVAAPPPFGDSVGPHLEDIVGRASASVEDFEYSEALQALDLVWDEETLDRWLQHPEAMAPAMCEPFMGIANPENRRALIAYLRNPPK